MPKWQRGHNKEHARNIYSLLINRLDESYSGRPNRMCKSSQKAAQLLAQRCAESCAINAKPALIRLEAFCQQVIHRGAAQYIAQPAEAHACPFRRKHILFSRQKKPRTSLGEGEVRG